MNVLYYSNNFLYVSDANGQMERELEDFGFNNYKKN